MKSIPSAFIYMLLFHEKNFNEIQKKEYLKNNNIITYLACTDFH